MAITTYFPSNSLSRFNQSKNWTKILFRPDRKLQTTEIEEIQDLIYNQISRVYSSIYDFYTVVRGCQIIVTAITTTGYQCTLTDGQIYIELYNDLGFFVEVDSISFTVNRDDITEIGLIFYLEQSSDLPEYRNPHSGGAAFGSEGANRILLRSEVIISPKTSPYTAGFYPLAIIKPKTLTFQTTFQDLGDGRPDILYYRNEELTEVFNERVLATYIKNLIEKRFHESAGNFISSGLYIIFNDDRELVSITPGIAYINGVRIETNYNYNFAIDISGNLGGGLESGYQYLFYLTDKGKFDIVSELASDSYLPEVPVNSIAIGYLIIRGYNSLEILDYNLIEAQTRMPKVSEIINLVNANEANNKELANITLQIDLLNASKNNINKNLNGIFVDSFVDLDNTDIADPEFNTSILPAIQAISLPFTSLHRDNRIFTLDTSNSNIISDTILNEFNEEVLYWSTINGTEGSLYNIRQITGSKEVPIFNSSSLNMRVSPSVIYKSDESTFINYTHPDIIMFTGLDEPVVINTPVNDNIYNRTLNISASGFPINQDNIIVQLNNVLITSFTFTEGSAGSTLGTVRASNAGNLAFSFSMPLLNVSDQYIISLTANNITATAEIFIKDPEVERTTREITSQFIVNSPPSYSTVNNGLAQTFNITEPTMVRAVEVTIMDFPNIISGSILNVYLVKIDSNNIPTDETLGFGSLNISEVNSTNEAVPLPSRINFDKPINLKRGSYAFIFQTALSGVELGIARPGDPNLINGLVFFNNQVDYSRSLINEAGIWTDNSTEYVDFRIITHKPISLLSSTIINLTSTIGQEFDIIDINMSIQEDSNSYITVYVEDEQGLFRLVEKGVFFFKSPILSTRVRIDMTGTSNTHPILELDNLNFNLLATQTQGVWVSKNQQYETPYDNLSFSVDVYKPNSAIIKYYFSSNRGVTWEELNESTATLTIETINDTLPINKYTFQKDNLGLTTVEGADNFRYNLRYKIEIEMDNLDGLYPFIKNIVSITNPS